MALFYFIKVFNALNTTYDVSVDIPKYIEHVLINNKVVDINNETIDVDLDDDAAYMKMQKPLLLMMTCWLTGNLTKIQET